MSYDNRSIFNASNRAAILVIFVVGLSLITNQTLISVPLIAANAETGTGKDVFKVIVSIFGITKETGDIAAAVTVNGNSKVKSFDIDNLNVPSADQNSSESADVVEFVATFPDVVVNAGDQYNACVLTLKTMDKYCEEGYNSPAKRPEFVDISMNKATKSDSGERKKSKVKDEGITLN
jgi:hypothetical protein